MAKREMWEIDEGDGLKREIVHAWVEEKHARLRRYVGASSGARKHYDGNSTYIELYSGTGRARIEKDGRLIDGSALVAAREAAKRVPFGHIHIGDVEQAHVAACEQRLCSAGFLEVSAYVGPAEDTAWQVAARLSRHGLHLAFLDPYNLDSLPFAVIKTLGQFPRMDLLIHVSQMDLQRDAIGKREYDKLDRFAPGWRNHVDTTQRQDLVRRQFLQYWQGLMRGLGYRDVRDVFEDVRGSKNQPLYSLVLASKHPIADELWNKIRNIHPQGRLF